MRNFYVKIQWDYIVKTLKKTCYHLRLYMHKRYPSKMSKLNRVKQFITRRTDLKETLKEVLQVEMRGHYTVS